MEKLNKKLCMLAEENSISLDSEQAELLIHYMHLLLEENKYINVTRITEENEFLEKHIIDSLKVLPLVPSRTKTIIDIGTGGGFPGVVIGICRPDIQVTLLDSTEKKLKLIERLTNKLDLKNFEFLHARAEEAGRNKEYRDHFDGAVSRAVAPLNGLLELSLPFIKPKGFFLALKSKNYENELALSEKILKNINASLVKVDKFDLYPSMSEREIIEFKKLSNTPKAYPRSFSKIKKEMSLNKNAN